MRRGVRNVLGAGATVLCLGGLLSACGGDSGDGYVATGAAGASPGRAPGKTVGPTGDVKMVPLERDGSGGGGRSGDSAGASPERDESSGASKSPGAEGRSGSGSGSDSVGVASPPGASSGRGGGRTGTGTGSGTGTGTGGSSPSPSGPGPGSGSGRPGTDPSPSGPAVLAVGDPERAPADKRWCEKVTVSFRNTGGSAVRSGEVTFGTHIIGALGVDWATIKSTVTLPAPIGPGRTREGAWTVCVDAWRVPLGMRVETRDVWVDWK
ncbi:hypothetical protein [Streptomyces sp. NPDC005865]|uniref:hypothetical protein n=1 Tax=Streptomyces sp. NPDC005865 TaxID=3155453 RepID=UPI0033F8567A